MRRLLVCFAYYFRGQRILPWICGLGLIPIAFGLFFAGRAGAQMVAVGMVCFAGFPILIGGLAFRQLISNRRVAMVPDIRYFATGALFLLAVCGAALFGFAVSRADPGPDAWRASLLGFAFISLYLVVSQWLVSHRAGVLAFLVVPLIVLRLSIASDPIVRAQLLAPWAWLALAGLAWLWLAIAVAGKGLPRHAIAAGTAGARAGGDAQGRGFWQALGGPAGDARTATAAGTLMRGSSDGWFNRCRNALMIVLLFPVVMSVTITLMGVPFRDSELPQFTGEFFLGTSFLGIYAFQVMLLAEWPVRLRLLWLRVAGDRADLWRRLERGLVQELLLVAAIASCVAAGMLVWSEVRRELVYVYLAGAVMVSLTSSYLGFLARISGWHSIVQGLLLPMSILSLLAGFGRLWSIVDVLAVFWVLPLLAILALVFRILARSRFLRMDWCAVRPLRIPRRMV